MVFWVSPQCNLVYLPENQRFEGINAFILWVDPEVGDSVKPKR